MAAQNRGPLRFSALATGCVAGLLVFGTATIASAEQEIPQEPPEIPEGGFSQGDLDSSISMWDLDAISVWDLPGSISELGDGETENEDVIVLEADILFSAMKWDLPASASSTIAELAEEVPDGATVDVQGHTDSNPVPDGYDFDNQVLSENRAEAVADVLEEERPDLDLNVEGFGDSEPAVDEDEEDPSTFAANRRVEIRYD